MDKNTNILQKNWEGLEIPDTLQVGRESFSEDYGKFILEPLHKGFGVTIGNAMRRVLLSSLRGCAVYGIKIEGVSHTKWTYSEEEHNGFIEPLVEAKRGELKIWVDTESFHDRPGSDLQISLFSSRSEIKELVAQVDVPVSASHHGGR